MKYIVCQEKNTTIYCRKKMIRPPVFGLMDGIKKATAVAFLLTIDSIMIKIPTMVDFLTKKEKL